MRVEFHEFTELGTGKPVVVNPSQVRCIRQADAEDQYLFVLAVRMEHQLILLISFLGGTGIVLGLAVGLAFIKKGPSRWLMIIGLIGLFWAIFYLSYWWTT